MLCEVCGKEAKTFIVPGTFGAYSFSACAECVKKHYEPYKCLTYGGGFGKIAAKRYPSFISAMQVKVIRNILKFYKKTDEEYIADCKKAVEEFEK